MKRWFVVMALLIICVSLPLSLFADDQSGRVGIGVYSGPTWLWQGNGNVLITEPAPDNPISEAGILYGGQIRIGIAPEFAIMFSGHYGENKYEGYANPADTFQPDDVEKMRSMIVPFDINAVITRMTEVLNVA